MQQSCASTWILQHIRPIITCMVIQCPGLSICNSDVTVSCDSHRVIPKFIASIVVVLVPMCGEHWLA